MKRIQKIVFLFFLLLIHWNCYRNLNEAEKQSSYVDLSNLNWEYSLPINVSSGWEFYWNQLLDPSFFKNQNQSESIPIVDFRPWTNLNIAGKKYPAKGYATYHKKIKIQNSKSNKRLDIYFSHLYTSSKVFINGTLIQEKGHVSSEFSDITPNRTNTSIELVVYEPEIDIVLQVANKDFYHGGPRSEFLIASAKQMQMFKNKSLVVEIFVFGLIFGSVLYHLFFYFINKDEKAFLYFAIVCITFLVRIPLLNSKLYEYFFPVLSFEFQTIFLHYVNIVTFVSALLFLNALFKSKSYKMIAMIFYLGGVLALLTPIAPKTVQHYVNFLYIIIYLFLFLSFAIYLLFKHKKDAQSLYLMAIALFSLGLFCFLAISLNYLGVQGGLFLILGYLFYVVFQTASLSKYFSHAVESRANIEMALHEESLQALSKQRTEMQLMVHDQLGANLTDLKVYLERKKSELIKQEDDTIGLDQIYQSVVSIIQSLRNQLLYIEDLNLIFENFVTGMHLTLLRRYSDAGREFEFLPSDSFVNYFNQIKIIGKRQNFFLNIFYMMYEICTNDIKYGKGESVWILDYSDGSFLVSESNLVEQVDGITKDKIELKSIQKRLGQLNGTIKVKLFDGVFEVKVSFPAESVLL